MDLIVFCLMLLALERGSAGNAIASIHETHQSGPLPTSLLATDDNLKTCTEILAYPSKKAWWTAVLDDIQAILRVAIFFHPNVHADSYVKRFDVFVSNDVEYRQQQLCNSFGKDAITHKGNYIDLVCVEHVVGQYITIMSNEGPRNQFYLCEVKIFLKEYDRGCTNGMMRCEYRSVCMPKKEICDRVKQCPDGSDERPCACLAFQYKCRDGPCIHEDWLCDGIEDCPRGDDETLPSCSCGDSEYKCRDTNKCIPITKRCDGLNDCQDFSDEFKCLKKEQFGSSSDKYELLKATFKGEENLYICSDLWNKDLSNRTCEYMGSKRNFLVKTEYLYLDMNGENLERNTHSKLKPGKILRVKANTKVNSDVPFMFLFEERSNCNSEKFVQVHCYATSPNVIEEVCGTRETLEKHFESGSHYIINGNEARIGAWPWQVQIISDEVTVCGASIIDDRWILTAAHCLSDLNSTSEIAIKVGTNIMNDEMVKNHSVESFILHPDYTSNPINNDIALIKISSPLLFNNLIRPICLPESNFDEKKLLSFRFCFISGFGFIDRNMDDPLESIYLQQGRMDIMSLDKCLMNLEKLGSKSIQFYREQLELTDKFCAGSPDTEAGVSPCRGDSGGPLVCMNEHGIWTQIGIISSYYSHRSPDKRHCTNTALTKVGKYLEFIHDNINR